MRTLSLLMASPTETRGSHCLLLPPAQTKVGEVIKIRH